MLRLLYSIICKQHVKLSFFSDVAATEIYTLSLHDALPIFATVGTSPPDVGLSGGRSGTLMLGRSEEHTSELQSRQYLVCRLLLEKKNQEFIKNVSDRG